MRTSAATRCWPIRIRVRGPRYVAAVLNLNPELEKEPVEHAAGEGLRGDGDNGPETEKPERPLPRSGHRSGDGRIPGSCAGADLSNRSPRRSRASCSRPTRRWAGSRSSAVGGAGATMLLVAVTWLFLKGTGHLGGHAAGGLGLRHHQLRLVDRYRPRRNADLRDSCCSSSRAGATRSTALPRP